MTDRTLANARDYADQARSAMATRDRWVRKAHENGHSLRTIAEAVGLTHAGVAKIVKRG